jgi:hypothetical protein
MDKENLLSPNEVVVAKLSTQIAEATTAYRNFHAAYEQTFLAVRQGLLAFFAQCEHVFKELQKIDWSEVDSRITQDALRLAELGWTIAPWMTPAEVSDIVSMSADGVDEEFVRFYLDEGGLDKAETIMIASPRLEHWRPLIVQTFEALRRKEHLIAIPALLLTLEGLVAQFADHKDLSLVHSTNVLKIIAGIQTSHGEKIIIARVWASTTAFLSQLYRRVPFSEECPSFVNRHWILHGRNVTKWGIADAIRVLNALCTLDWLMSREEGQRNTVPETMLLP